MNLRILFHNNEIEFPDDKTFFDYIKNLKNKGIMHWTHCFWKEKSKKLFTEGDLILIIRNGIIYAKGIIEKHEPVDVVIDGISYKSATSYKKVEDIKSIPYLEFEEYFKLKPIYHGEKIIPMNVTDGINEKELNDFLFKR